MPTAAVRRSSTSGRALFDALEREGLERIDPVDAPFDPTVHDAVAHEPGDGDGASLRSPRSCAPATAGRVASCGPAMVKVRG